MEGGEIELKDMIEQLRKQLTEAVKAGKDRDVRFAVESIDLELQIAVGRNASGDAGVKFWVVTAGAKAGFEQRCIQTMKLKLVPGGAWRRDGGGEIGD